MKRLLAVIGLALLLAPVAGAQASKPEYRKLKISTYYCQNPRGTNPGDPSGCVSKNQAGYVVWDFPDCGPAPREYDAASCSVTATPSASGVLADVAVSCTEKRFEKPARECARAHRLQDQHKGDLTPVCLTLDYAKRDRKTAIGRPMSPPPDVAIRELASCPAAAG